MTETDRKVAVGAGVMLLRAGKILLGRRRSALGRGTYGWCGGSALSGESPLAAARREVEEECGIKVGALTLLSVGLFQFPAQGRDFVDFEFRAEEFSGEPQVREPDKVESWAWYPLHDLPSPLFAPTQLGLDAHLGGRIIHQL